MPSLSSDIISPSIQYPLPVSNFNTSIPVCPPEYSYLGGDSGLTPGNYRHDFPENLSNSYGYRTPKNFGISYHTAMPTSTSGVPTGCLIELDPPNLEKSHSIKMNHKNCLDEVDLGYRHIGNNDHYAKVDRKSSKPSSNSENWDYVYAGLESIGHSKDLGDRDDILYRREVGAHSSKHKPPKPSKPTEYEEKFLKFEKRRLNRVQNESESATNSRSNHHEHQYVGHKKKSSFDAADSNSRTEFFSDKIQEKSKKINQTMPNSNIFQTTDAEEQIAQYMRDLNLSQNDNKKDDMWTCTWCTFWNTPDKSICEMCVKSRFKGNEDMPLASGGKECPLCTLVNEKDVLRCSACDADLTNSPTYI